MSHRGMDPDDEQEEEYEDDQVLDFYEDDYFIVEGLVDVLEEDNCRRMYSRRMLPHEQEDHEDNVHIRSEGLPQPIVNENEICKYYKAGDHVKVVSGAQDGATGMVVKVEQHFLIILSDATKEHICVLADNVVESSEATTAVTRIVNHEHHDSELRDNSSFGVIIPVESKALQDDAYSRFSSLRTPTCILQSQRRFSRRGPLMDFGGRWYHGLKGSTVKIIHGPYKGCLARVMEVNSRSVLVALKSQTKMVTVELEHISKPVAFTPFGGMSRYEMGTPMCGRASKPYKPMSPPWDSSEDGNPGTRGALLQYQPGGPLSCPYDAPAPAAGWASAPNGYYSEAGTPHVSSAYATASSPYLPLTPGRQPMTTNSTSYLPGTSGGQLMTPGTCGLDMISPVLGGDSEGLRFMPDILVNVHRYGEELVMGVIREVLQDGSCKVGLGSSGNGETITALPNEMKAVVPMRSDKLKIIGGALRGATGKLIGVDGTMGFVKIYDPLAVRILDLAILAKLAQA